MNFQKIAATSLGAVVLSLAGQADAQTVPAATAADAPKAAESALETSDGEPAPRSRWTLRAGRRPFHYPHHAHYSGRRGCGDHHRYGIRHGKSRVRRRGHR